MRNPYLFRDPFQQRRRAFQQVQQPLFLFHVFLLFTERHNPSSQPKQPAVARHFFTDGLINGFARRASIKIYSGVVQLPVRLYFCDAVWRRGVFAGAVA
jgi:hypothetical protein